MHLGIVHQYKDYLPFLHRAAISLSEGSTPLLRLDNLASYIENNYGVELTLYAKIEGMNPTGSFKDRGMTTAISKEIGRASCRERV